MLLGTLRKINQHKMQWWHGYVIAIFLGLSIGTILTISTMRAEDAEMREELLQQLKSIDQALDWSEIEQQSLIQFNPESAAWLRFKTKLQGICRVTLDCKYLYLMYQDASDHLRVPVDNTRKEDADYETPNYSYPDATPRFKGRFQTHQDFTEGPEQDLWGVWITGIITHATPNQEKIWLSLGMDIDAKNWQASIYHSALTPIAATCAYLILIIYLLMLHTRERSKKEKLQSKTQALYNEACFDRLTGLANRVLFEDKLKQIAATAQRSSTAFAVLFMDLDGFKNINDTHGHTLGDQVLASAAQKISAVVRTEDTLARFGGDEFVMLLPRVQFKQQVYLVAQKLVDSLIEPIVVNGQSHQLGLSVGFAIYPDDTSDVIQLILLADAAMYAAKKAGKNQAKSCTELSSATLPT